MGVRLTEPAADDQVKLIYRKGMRFNSAALAVGLDELHAICVLKLNNMVTTDDHATLEAALEGVTGVQNATILADYLSRSSVPSGTALKAQLSLDINLVDE